MNILRGAPEVSVRLATVMLVGVMLLWASGVIVARSVHDLVPPVGFSFWRWIVAVVVLTPFAGAEAVRKWSTIRTLLGRLALLGLFMAGGSTLLVWSVQFTAASNVALVSAAQPMVTAMMAALVLRERLRVVQIIGIAAAAGGIAVMVARLDPAVFLELNFNPGDVLVLLAVVFYALYAVNLHRWVKGLSAVLMMYLTAIAGMLVLLPFYLTESAFVAAVEFRLPVLAAIGYMALVPTLLATTMWNISVGVVGPSRASIFINLLPVFGTVLAVLLLGEQLYLYHLVGGLMVCAGITLVVRGGSD